MELIIRPESRISDLQTGFTAIYPYLKVEFFRLIITTEKFAPRRQRVEGFVPVKKFCILLEPNQFPLDKTRTISDVEDNFRQVLGLATEIYRKSGQQWIETSLTEDWTLEHQNLEGEQMSTSYV